MLVVRTANKARRVDGSSTIFKMNAGLLIRKKQNPKSKYLQGPTIYQLKRKKFKSLYKIIL